MRRLIEHKIDRPNTQCKLIARMRKTYFQLNILRRNCAKKYGKNQVRQDVRKALRAKKEARAIKQAQRAEKKRTKRGKILIVNLCLRKIESHLILDYFFYLHCKYELKVTFF